MATRRTLLERLRADVLAGFGLVHRIDQDTSGLVILARGDLKVALSAAFAAEGEVEKVYDALVEGVPEALSGTIDLPLADPGHGTRARVDPRRGKPATTVYSVTEVLGRAARVRAVPLTGRTHQIRVHLAWIGTPLLVDPLYGRRAGWRLVNPKGGPAGRLARTPLHAAELTFTDPRDGVRRSFKTPLLDDHRRALEVLRVVAAREAGTRPHGRRGTRARPPRGPARDGRRWGRGLTVPPNFAGRRLAVLFRPTMPVARWRLRPAKRCRSPVGGSVPPNDAGRRLAVLFRPTMPVAGWRFCSAQRCRSRNGGSVPPDGDRHEGAEPERTSLLDDPFSGAASRSCR